MKILRAIASTHPKSGGPIEGLRQMEKALREFSHETEVASLDDPKASWISDFNFKVHALGPGILKYGYSPRWTPWLKKNLSHYDAVIIDGLWQYSSFGTWLALRDKKIPYFVYPHGMLDPWFKHAYPLKHLKKACYWNLAEHRVLRDAQAVLFTAEQEKVLARQSFSPYACREVVAGFGIAAPEGDAEKQRKIFLDQFPTLKTRKFFLFLGRIHPKKGCDLLIEAFAKIAAEDPSIDLVIAGPDDGWKSKLEGIVTKLNLKERVIWTGMLSGDLKWGALQAAEVFVLPTHQENFGLAIVEALACGLPVLTTNQVNIWREIVREGAGLVANDNREGIFQLLSQWLDLPREEKERMKQNAFHCFQKHFEIQKIATSLADILSKGIHEQCPTS